ncbi:MAG: YdcF family protein [Lachnospiraceae bacterium]|jgi:uncharacterized SAM-binding protein YcdF (DUF218 family)|nr:YdcF family protein [Lachnospiraceae bacterium]
MKKLLMGIWLILALFCMLYANVIRQVGSGTGFFVVWVLLSICFMLLAAATKLELWKKLPKRLRITVISLLCVGFASFLAVEALVIGSMNEKGEEGLNYIIVLGAQVRKSGPSKVLKYRLEEARAYMKRNPDTICILSGGKGANEPTTEAAGMLDYMLSHGISSDRLKLEGKSTTTAENIKNSRHLIEQGASVGIITNDFHVFRAVQTAKRYGLSNAVGIAAPSPKKYLVNNMFREFFGEIKFLISLF